MDRDSSRDSGRDSSRENDVDRTRIGIGMEYAQGQPQGQCEQGQGQGLVIKKCQTHKHYKNSKTRKYLQKISTSSKHQNPQTHPTSQTLKNTNAKQPKCLNGHGVIRTTKGNPFCLLIWLDRFLSCFCLCVCFVQVFNGFWGLPLSLHLVLSTSFSLLLSLPLSLLLSLSISRSYP